jgi:hypothetical protein
MAPGDRRLSEERSPARAANASEALMDVRAVIPAHPRMANWRRERMRGAAAPEAVEPSGELDARRANTLRREEEDRPGMRVGRVRDEDRDEPIAQRFDQPEEQTRAHLR